LTTEKYKTNSKKLKSIVAKARKCRELLITTLLATKPKCMKGVKGVKLVVFSKTFIGVQHYCPIVVHRRI
jgi:hypothetical protein